LRKIRKRDTAIGEEEEEEEKKKKKKKNFKLQWIAVTPSLLAHID
jgi:hypothetical protein